MRRRALATALAAAALASARATPAQPVPAALPRDPGAQTAFAGLGLEPELVLTAGWLRALPATVRGAPLAAGVGVKVAPLALFEHGTWRVNALVGGDVRWTHGLGAGFSAAAYVVHDDNDAAETYGLGLEARVAPGLRGARWSGGLDLGWQGTLVAHVAPTALARRTFEGRYPDGVAGVGGPRGGWYGSTAHRFRVGVQAARTLGDRVALGLALGALVSYQRQGILFGVDLAQVPIYVESTVRVAW